MVKSSGLVMKMAVSLASISVAVSLTHAADGAWPQRPIRIVHGSPPAGTADIIARLVGAKVSEQVGQSVIAENRVGAGATVGTDFVAKAAPDGYTFLMITSGTHLLTSLVSKNVPYDPIRDFTAITAATESYSSLAVTTASHIGSVRELLDLARKYPGKLTYSSAGIGTAFHLTGAMFAR